MKTSFVIWHCTTGVAPHSTPKSGGSEVAEMFSVVGLVWISSKPLKSLSGVSMMGESEALFPTTFSVDAQSSSLTCVDGSPFTVSVISLSFSEGGLVLVGVHSLSLAERPLNPSSSAPRGFWWIRWCRTRLCFRVKVRSHVWHL